MEASDNFHNIETGKKGEAIAAAHLEKKGYEIVARNYVAGKVEIDLICRLNRTFIFVEVKTRFNALVQPELAVDFRKQHHIARAASSYLHRFQIKDPVRFDIIAIHFNKGETDIVHFEDAFYPVFYK